MVMHQTLGTSSVCCTDSSTTHHYFWLLLGSGDPSCLSTSRADQSGADTAQHLLKLLVKDKLLHSGKVPVNVELTRDRSSAIRHFEGGNGDVTK